MNLKKRTDLDNRFRADLLNDALDVGNNFKKNSFPEVPLESSRTPEANASCLPSVF